MYDKEKGNIQENIRAESDPKTLHRDQIPSSETFHIFSKHFLTHKEKRQNFV